MATRPTQQQEQASITTRGYFEFLGLFEPIPDATDHAAFHSGLLLRLLNPNRLERGHVSFSFVVYPAIVNPYNTLHGGVVAGLAEEVALACARTVAGDKELFTGESNTAYLAAAKLNDEVQVDAHVLRQGRRVIVISVDFRIKKTQQILYTTRLTLYNMPVSKL